MARKAGKRKPPANKHGEAKAKLERLGIEGVCEIIAETGTMTRCAQNIGVSIGKLIEWIEASPERSARARQLRSFMAAHWDEKAEEVIEQAADQLGIAKARELAQHYRWRASKIAPRDYGEKVQVDANVGIHTLTDDQIDRKLADLVARAAPTVAARAKARAD